MSGQGGLAEDTDRGVEFCWANGPPLHQNGEEAAARVHVLKAFFRLSMFLLSENPPNIKSKVKQGRKWYRDTNLNQRSRSW